MQYFVNPEIFSRYPGFIRAVVIAEGIDNTAERPELLAELRACERHARERLDDKYKEHPRLAVWGEVFREQGINPNKFPPSVVNLVKRARSGKDLPYVNTLVAAFNCISLRNLCPCGGDDLAAVKGDLALTFAKGDELYVPLGQPDVAENPPVGEVIYMDTATKDVFCRTWCWKNGDRSKLAASTTRAAVNIDIMPPLGMAEAESFAAELSSLLQQHTGAKTSTHFLTPQTVSFAVA